MKNVDTSMFVGQEKANRIKPESINFGDLPPIQKREKSPTPSQQEPEAQQSHRNTVTPEYQNTSVTSHQDTGIPEHRHTEASERERKKHGFVVYRDQVASLEKLVLALWQRTGEKPEVGEIVREGLEYIIEKKKQELGL